jgi:outer membrane protein OmpA-like peptidoglycan-associated protein
MLFSAQVLAEDCNKGEKFYLKGLEAGKSQDWGKAEKFLQQSTSVCNRFNNWYLLGQVEQELKKYDDAAIAFEDAKRYATGDDEKAIAIARYAEVQSTQGLINEPLTLLRVAKKMHSKAPQWVDALTRQLDEKRVKQPLTVAQVTRALTNRSIKLFNLNTKPSLDVSIHFKFDSTEVVEASSESVEVLATALMDESLKGKRVTIVGHTDEQGSPGYNDGLSKKRADRIAKAIMAKYPQLKGRIITRGAGEHEPLYTGNTDWDYQMNRRIEIKMAN